MKKIILSQLMLATAFAIPATLTSCLNSDEETIILETPVNNTGIPDDSEADPNPDVDEDDANAYIPNIQTTLDDVDGTPVIRIDMTGVQDPNNAGWMKLYGTGSPNQNIWVEVDGMPKGIDVYNSADGEGSKTIKTDIVFTIDNSGSMSEEADAIARDILSWAQQLENSGLDMRFGIVGYDGRITGAINLTNVKELKVFLDYSTGTSRTNHFEGTDANTLQTAANEFANSYYECGAAAIQYADKNFKFRAGANRIYVNFTDEPNQPNGNSKYSVKYFESQSNWPASKGTVHTIYSSGKFENNNWNREEQPWLISEYTGGTTMFASSSFTGVTLSSLPVTGAMQNSYIIRFTNIDDMLDGQPHKVHITIRSKDGSVQGDKTFYVVFGQKQANS